jgi:hypothetical protein
MSELNREEVPTVILDVPAPLSVTFEAVGSRINFVLEENDNTTSTDKGATSTSKYELYKVEE